MIDIHNHILFGTDDGSKSIEESMEMLRKFEKHGYTDIIVTPHYIKGVYINDTHVHKRKLNELKQIVKDNDINISLYLGNEVYLEVGIEELIKSKKVSTLNDSRYILIEKPRSSRVASFEVMMMDLKSRGYIPIIAHPERYSYIHDDIEMIEHWIEHGMLMQMNLNSLQGVYGSHVKKTAVKLLENNLIHFVSTDVHNSKSDFNSFVDALNKTKSIVGQENFDIITKYNQLKVIKDEVIEPFPFNKKKENGFLNKIKRVFKLKY